MIAMMAMGSFALIPNLASADTVYQSLWIRVGGVITQWGTTPAFGWLGAYAALVNANGTYYGGAKVHAIWATETRRLNYSAPPTPENFTFSFYAAGLAETSMVRRNYTIGNTTYDLFISGLWNVINVTTTILVNGTGALISFTRTIEPVVTNATGAFVVIDNWTHFALNITGIDLLSGLIIGGGYFFKEVKICDLNNDGKVDIVDLVKVAKSYRAVPGLWNYNHDADFNGDNQINMGDLTTVAANMES